jgi:hypothetical protein
MGCAGRRQRCEAVKIDRNRRVKWARPRDAAISRMTGATKASIWREAHRQSAAQKNSLRKSGEKF